MTKLFGLSSQGGRLQARPPPPLLPVGSACFWRVQPALSQALIIINQEEKQYDAVLLYLYKYICVYIYIYIKKICTLMPGFFRFREIKLGWKGLSKVDLFFSFPELLFYCFSYPMWHKVITSCPGFFFIVLLFCFLSEFCHFKCFVGEADVLSWLFVYFEGRRKKEKHEHGALCARGGNCLAGWWCAMVPCEMTRSWRQCPGRRGLAFAIAICFLKLSVFQC